jgi:hypothetical protein
MEPEAIVNSAQPLRRHQFHSPMTCMNAGIDTIRINVASASTASVGPSPNIRKNDTSAAIDAANEMDITTAAAVTTPPGRATPRGLKVGSSQWRYVNSW